MSSLIDLSDRIFVAGHRGMAGSAILRCLRSKGYGESNGGSLLKATREELDLRDSKAVDIWMDREKPQVVVLAAAKVGGIYANSHYPAEFLLDNLKIESNVIEGAWRNGVRRLCFLGSSCIYPKFAEQPIKEESLLTGSLEPTNEWYAVAKIAGIKLCEALRQQFSFDAFSLMPTNLYGPGDNYHPKNSHVMAALIRRFSEAVQNNSSKVICWGSGKPRREFLHADDLADAVVFCLENWDLKEGEPSFLNVGTGEDLMIKDLAEKIAFATGYKGEILWDQSKPDGTPRKLLDVSRLTSKGWSAKISIDNGIGRTVADWKNC